MESDLGLQKRISNSELPVDSIRSKLGYATASSLGRLAIGVSFILLGTLAMAATDGYHLLKKFTFGAAEGSSREYFDYITVDSSARRVYLSHGTEVKVIDADNGALIGNITGLTQDHGIAVASEFGRGFISDGPQSKVIIFDLETLKVIGETKTGNGPDCVIYDPASKHVFSMNGGSHSSTVIDPKDGNVVGTIDLGGAPEFGVADGKGTVYVNLEDKSEVVAIDSRTLTVNSRWPVAPSGGPTALAMDREHRRLFSSGRNPQMLVVMDAKNGKVIQSFPISEGVDASVYEPETDLLFVSTREGMIHIFHEDSPDKFSVVDTVKTEYGAKAMGLDTKTHNLFLDTADYGPPPPPTAERPHPLRTAIPGTFRVLVYARNGSDPARN
jgi:DNA-binding beta-propeller fold protein YncE